MARRGTRVQRFGPGWESTSRRIIARDGGVCQLRLAGCTGIATTADHVVSRAAAKRMGWTLADINAEWNLQASCLHCNSSKGDR